MKKSLLSTAASLALILGIAPAVQAQIIIDYFLNDSTNISVENGGSAFTDNTVTGASFASDRRLIGSVTGDFSMDTVVESNSWIADAGGPGTPSGTANSQVLYFPDETLNVGENIYLQVDIALISGTPLLGVQLQNGTTTISGAAQLNAGSNYQVFLDITGFSGYFDGFLADVDSITVFVADASQPFFSQVTQLSFNSVPEPGSGLLALGAGLVFLMRRGVRRPVATGVRPRSL